MKQPGERLRAFAARLCSPRTMERLIDPVIGDLQAEYREAQQRGAAWKARRVRLAGLVAFAKVLLWAALVGSSNTLDVWGPSETILLRRASVWFVGVTVISTVLLALNGPEYDHASRILLALYVVPSLLPLTAAIGVAFAALCALDRERLTRRVAMSFVAGSLVCSLVMLANVVWVMPDSNQAYRETAFGGPLLRGDREMSMSELKRLGELRPDQARRFAITYHTRGAIAAAPLALMSVSLVLVPRRRRWRLAGAPTAALLCFAYWILLLTTNQLGVWTMLPPLLIVWLPNIAFAILAAALASRRAAATS
jgi:Lipopolysaccharide export system permease LptF/LptG